MRTTIDIPDELLQRAKIAAIERGATLKELFMRALQRELNQPLAVETASRTPFPIFRSQAPGSLKLSPADILRLEDEEDVRRHGVSD